MENFCAWIHKPLKVTQFKTNIAYPVGASRQIMMPPPEFLAQADEAIFNYIHETQGAFTDERITKRISRYFENYIGMETRHTCEQKKCGAGSSVIGVTPKGEFLPCGRFQWDDKD